MFVFTCTLSVPRCWSRCSRGTGHASRASTGSPEFFFEIIKLNFYLCGRSKFDVQTFLAFLFFFALGLWRTNRCSVSFGLHNWDITWEKNCPFNKKKPHLGKTCKLQKLPVFPSWSAAGWGRSRPAVWARRPSSWSAGGGRTAGRSCRRWRARSPGLENGSQTHFPTMYKILINYF